MVVPTHWDFLMGGAQLQAKFLLEELITRPGVKVNYFASRVNANSKQTEGYTLTQISPPGRLHRYGLFWDYFSLQQHLAHYKPDLIYQRVATAYTGICATYARRHAIPMIWHIANSTDCDINRFSLSSLRRPHAYLEKALIQHGLKNTDQIVVQNADQKAQISANFGKQNSHLIPNFHPIPEAPTKPASKPLKVLWIANLKDSKRPQAMVEVAKLLSHTPDIKITMIGAPYLAAQQAEQRAFEASIKNLPNLTYAGELPNDEVNALLEHSHLLVNTSIKEGFSNTFIQAWLRCVPVLSLGVNPDNRLDGGPLGKSFAAIDNLAAAILERLKQPKQLTQDGAMARHIAQQDFSLNNASKLADLLLSLRRDS